MFELVDVIGQNLKLTKDLADRIEELRLRLSMECLSSSYSLLEVALNYALASPNVSIALVGATSAAQIRQNASIAERTDFTLDDR
jgi:aryl-alcohol dehydrogenase-like predicted oxidoreductase